MKIIKKILLACVFIAPVVLVLLLPRFIKVKKIDCLNPDGFCSDEVGKKLADIPHSSYFRVKKQLKIILGKNPLIKDYFLQYKLDGSLDVTVEERHPAFILANENEKWMLNIGRDGTVLSVTENSELPTIFLENKLPSLGERIDDKILFSFNILEGMPQYSTVVRALYKDDELLIDIDNGLKVIFPVEGDRNYLLGSFYLVDDKLKKINEELKLEILSYNIIDLRFKDPILRKE